MVNRDSGWRPKGMMDAYAGYGEMWEYNVGPHQINEGEKDGVIDFGADVEDGDFATSVEELDDE